MSHPFSKPESEPEGYQPSTDQILSSIDGSVQSNGIKVSHRDWLDMGSEGWQKTPDTIKAAAYQAAIATNWDEARLVEIMLGAYNHLTEHMMETTMTFLKELAKDHPLHIEQQKETEIEVPVRAFTNPNAESKKE